MSDELTRLIIDTGSRFGVEAARLYPQVIYFFWIKSLVAMIIAAAMPLIAIPATYASVNWLTREIAIAETDPHGAPTPKLIASMATTIICAVTSIIGAVMLVENLPLMIASIASPEVAFLYDIVKSAKR